ncbi:MAG: pteridine reductase [Lysobacter sp.]|nr:MAG: pteridine reductase [Lysobacter sp.]
MQATSQKGVPHRVVLVTGAARRIGADIARCLHAAGCDLALHYRSAEDDMAALVDELEQRRAGSVLALRADLAEFDRLPELIARAVGRFGHLDGLVNNASGFRSTPLGHITPADWDELMGANARAPLFLSQAAAPHLRAARGAIVNLVDVYAERPLPGHSVYCMAKAALVMATRALALELGPEVRVNAVAPGAILWPEAPGGGGAAARDGMLARTPLERIGTPMEVAEAVRWLLFDATYCTGQVIAVDGGRLVAG